MGSNWADATRLLREPDDRDLAPDPERQDELLREQRWAEFVAFIRAQASEFRWPTIVMEVTFAMHGGVGAENAVARTMQTFADSEGWPDTLRAIARAMAEQEAEAAEIERRR